MLESMKHAINEKFDEWNRTNLKEGKPLDMKVEIMSLYNSMIQISTLGKDSEKMTVTIMKADGTECSVNLP